MKKQGLNTPALQFSEYAVIESWIDHLQRAHEFVYDWHHIALISAIYHLQKLAIALVVYCVFDCRSCERVHWCRVRVGLFLASHVIQDDVVCRKLDAGICIWIALPLTFGNRFVQVLFRNQGQSPPYICSILEMNLSNSLRDLSSGASIISSRSSAIIPSLPE